MTTADLTAAVNARTGLLDVYKAGGIDFLEPGAFSPLVIRDNADPWGMKVRSFRAVAGSFAAATPEQAARFSGIRDRRAPRQPATRVIEDGEVRTVVEAILAHGDSRLVLRYKIPKRGAEIEIDVRVFWTERDAMLKLGLAPRLRAARFMGQVAYGADELPSNGDEAVAQKWLALVSETDGAALTLVNEGVYGSDWDGVELRQSLLRSPAYAADTWEDKLAVARDRFIPRQDMGERSFRFWLRGGPLKERLEAIDREALAHNEDALRPRLLPSRGRKADASRGRRRRAGRRGHGAQEVGGRQGHRHPPFRADGPGAPGRRQAPGSWRANDGPAQRIRDQDPALQQKGGKVRRDRPS